MFIKNIFKHYEKNDFNYLDIFVIQIRNIICYDNNVHIIYNKNILNLYNCKNFTLFKFFNL